MRVLMMSRFSTVAFYLFVWLSVALIGMGVQYIFGGDIGGELNGVMSMIVGILVLACAFGFREWMR